MKDQRLDWTYCVKTGLLVSVSHNLRSHQSRSQSMTQIVEFFQNRSGPVLVGTSPDKTGPKNLHYIGIIVQQSLLKVQQGSHRPWQDLHQSDATP